MNPSLFGDKTWGDIHAQVDRRLRQRYRLRLSTQHDIEDAVAAAMLDLVDYWVHLPSSLDLEDPERNFKWASWRATRTATQFLIQRFDERRNQVSLSGNESEDENYIPRSERLVEPTAGPEDVACADDEATQVRALIDDLPETDHERWLAGLLEGLSTYECAAKSGLSAEAERKRRNKGVSEAKRIAKAREIWP